MKQLIKGKLPQKWIEEIGSDPFVIADLTDPFFPKLIAHGVNPSELAKRAMGINLDNAKAKIDGFAELYRLDEVKRNA